MLQLVPISSGFYRKRNPKDSKLVWLGCAIGWHRRVYSCIKVQEGIVSIQELISQKYVEQDVDDYQDDILQNHSIIQDPASWLYVGMKYLGFCVI